MKNIVHRGITWRDFPGNCEDNKRFAFALFKRGRHEYNQHCGDLEGEALKSRLHEVAKNKSLRWRSLNARTWGHGSFTT
jgi:hypothetical protein